MSHVTRRSFLKRSAQGLAAASVALPAIDAFASVLGANERIRVGVAGINGRGGNHIDEFVKMREQGVEIAYLIDPDSSLFESRAKRIAEKGGQRPTCVQDIRKALEDKSLNAVSVATCNHWHSLITIWACQAGKDVYVEKPLSHNVHEGRVAVEAARKYGRIVQHGTQQRGSGGRAREIAAVQSGKYGKLLVSKGYCAKARWSIGRKEPKAPPSHLDFNLWLGPAPEQPYHENLVHYNWHWFWDTGNGDIGNQGVHEMDVARWAVKGATLPKRVLSLGGRFGYEDQGQTPNTQMAVFDYGEALVVFEVRGLVGNPSKDKAKVANEYYTDGGMIAGGKFYPKGGGDPEPLADAGGGVRPGGVFENFIDCVRSRKAEDLNAGVAEGHYSSALCHLANISYRLGEIVPFDKKSGALGDDRVVLDTFKALEDNLSAGNGLKLDGLQYRLGRTLSFDAATESFIGDEEANRLLTREYRPPFVVPAKLV
jgi:predicted dehydrogenase